MSTSIENARAALFAMLEAETQLAGVQVVYGQPADYEEQEVVAIGGLVDSAETQFTFGPFRQESFGIEVKYKAHNPAATSADVGARASELGEAIRSSVLSDRSLQGTVLTAEPGGIQPDGSEHPVNVADGGGFVAFQRIVVRCLSVVT